jgi:O-antigen ligase
MWYSSMPFLSNFNFINNQTLQKYYSIDDLKNSFGESLITRKKMWLDAIEIGMSSPLLGVGLNNYINYQTSNVQKIKFYSIFSNKNSTIQVFDDPHNLFLSIFSQTGIIGFLIFIYIFTYFFKQDYFFLKNVLSKNRVYIKKILLLKISLIISFWLLIIYLFFHPFNTIRSFFYFSFFRILITKY